MSGGQSDQSAFPKGREVDVFGDESQGSGWLFFAGTILGLAGLMRVVDALWAFGYDGALPENLTDGVIGENLNNYAWVWLGVGLVLIVASLLLQIRSQFARWIGMIAAAILALTAMTWMPYYPVWALTYVGMAMLVLYGLAKHGGRVG